MRRSLGIVCAMAAWAYAVGMVFSVSAAQNPCVKNWQWQWKIPPVLEIAGPDVVPDQCVGPISVSASVSATPGVKWEVDINNCPEPPHTRNETTVPITPVNTWELYLRPLGTTPLSGNGTTANFTTIHGGSVVVQFKTRATVASPPWDSGMLSDLTTPFRVFEVVSLSPDQGCEVLSLDPDNKVFRICPGPQTITVTATPNPSVASQSELPPCWTLTGPGGSGKLVRTIPASTGTYNWTCTSGTSRKTLKVLVEAKTYEIQITTFIPTEVVLYGYVSCLDWLEGDNRGFDSGATSFRTRQKVKIDPNCRADGLVPNSWWADVGVSRCYANDGVVAGHILPAAKADTVLGDCHYKVHQKKGIQGEDWWQSALVYKRPSDGVVEVYASCKAYVPVVPFAPAIDYCFTLTFSPSCTDPAVTHWTLSGTHDGFPSYEIYVNGTAIYQYAAQSIGGLFGPDCGLVPVQRDGNL